MHMNLNINLTYMYNHELLWTTTLSIAFGSKNTKNLLKHMLKVTFTVETTNLLS